MGEPDTIGLGPEPSGLRSPHMPESISATPGGGSGFGIESGRPIGLIEIWVRRKTGGLGAVNIRTKSTGDFCGLPVGRVVEVFFFTRQFIYLHAFQHKRKPRNETVHDTRGKQVAARVGKAAGFYSVPTPSMWHCSQVSREAWRRSLPHARPENAPSPVLSRWACANRPARQWSPRHRDCRL